MAGKEVFGVGEVGEERARVAVAGGEEAFSCWDEEDLCAELLAVSFLLVWIATTKAGAELVWMSFRT